MVLEKMGGLIALTVREEVDKERSVVVPTNNPNVFINNIRLSNKDPLHVQRFLRSDSPMRAKDSSLFPTDYGLIVVDYVNDQILAHDQYGGLGEFYFSHKRLVDYKCNFPLSCVEEGLGIEEYEGTRFYELLNANRISYARFGHLYDDDGETRLREERVDLKDVELSGLDERGLIEKINSLSEINGADCDHVGIDLSPFVITHYDDLNQMRQRIKELGFRISPEDEKAWDEFIRNKLISENDR
ncbi:hypothetical protein GOV12_00040 [Candidatus Pacearchaeota archaeon]|nr:hypothetical protein [Candidatus Pacearchaeota archaeon]